MNKNLNLAQILKNCPKGTKLYSLVHGDVEFYAINEHSSNCQIVLKCGDDLVTYSTTGKYIPGYRGECVLFPSKENRDWSKFKVKQHKFDPAILKPFDKVLARDTNSQCWKPQLFLYIIKYEEDYPYLCTNDSYKYCIPYNEETKHLVGTTDDAPEFYRLDED